MNDEPRSPGEAIAAADAARSREPQADSGTRSPVATGQRWTPPDPSKAKKTAVNMPGVQIPHATASVDERWTVAQVKAGLLGLTGAAAGVGDGRVKSRPTHHGIRMTREEVDSLAPPLTNIINRHDYMRQMASASDAINAGLGLMGYGMRVAAEAKETADDRRREDAERMRRRAVVETVADHDYPAQPEDDIDTEPMQPPIIMGGNAIAEAVNG